VAEALKNAIREMKTPVKAALSYRHKELLSQQPPEGITIPTAREEKLPFGVKMTSEPAPSALVPPETSRETNADPVLYAITDPIPSTITSPVRILGQVMGTYIILDGENGLEIVDQHAAHERIVFNRLMRKRAGEGIPVQQLAVPFVLNLSPSEAANLLASVELLNSFGFDVGEFGPSTVRITAVPSDLKDALIEELLGQIASDPDSLGKEPEEIALAVSRWACRQSVMAGQRLSESQIQALVRELDEAESGFSCPHGRPTRVTLDLAELEKLFGRR
jgi:DNA mismatch repair protein MutL